MSSYLKVKAEHVTTRGFTDGAEHRAPLPPVYNQYALMTAGNGFNPDHDDHQMIYRPLFTTSFVLDDYLDDNDFFGASSVILSSASSKTAFGLAFLLHKNRDVKVIGLTSPSNREFVESMGIYDVVVSYDDIESLDASEPAAFVDMAGNRQVLETLHNHYQDNMKCSAGVGITHYDARDGADPAELPGANPAMFFAPSQIEKRNKDWGPRVFRPNSAKPGKYSYRMSTTGSASITRGRRRNGRNLPDRSQWCSTGSGLRGGRVGARHIHCNRLVT